MSKLSELIAELCPDGVEYQPVKYVATIRNGKDHKALSDGDIPVYGSGGIMRYVDTASYDKPSVLLPRKGSLSNVFYVDQPFWNVDTIFHTIINEERVLPKYFYYAMCNAHVEQYGTEGARPSLTQSVLNDVKIPVPPIEVQREVVRILDSFQELDDALTAEIGAREKQFKVSLERLVQRISPVDSARLSDICERITKGTTPKTVGFDFTENGVFFYKTESIDNFGHLIPQNVAFVSEDCHAKLSRSQLADGDILFSIAGAIGRMLLIGEEMLPANTNQALAIIRLAKQSDVTPKYLYYLLSSEFIKKQAINRSIGSAQQNVSLKDIASIVIPRLGVFEQEQFVHSVASIHAYCDLVIAERDARRKQFAYYRDKLLDLPEKVTKNG